MTSTIIDRSPITAHENTIHSQLASHMTIIPNEKYEHSFFRLVLLDLTAGLFPVVTTYRFLLTTATLTYDLYNLDDLAATVLG